jgi:hypothetical protein
VTNVGQFETGKINQMRSKFFMKKLQTFNRTRESEGHWRLFHWQLCSMWGD